ncbi:hypothetical protein ACFSX9_13545 [Flavobacterium ardleyense]|uniref:Uncharacterized protein n=1 Tax=Flavobacterium ardleyense TaxID=2038737 RepID=A0ABW5ZCE5_9FLAO
MKNKPLHIAIDIINENFQSATTAYLTKSINNNYVKSIQVIIINEIYDYFTFEHFNNKGYDVEVIFLPKSILFFTEKHIDFIQEHDLFNSISKGKILRDTNSIGEKLQQMYEVISASLLSLEPSNTYKKLFKLSSLISEFENAHSKVSIFILKNKIVGKINGLLKNHLGNSNQIIKLEDSFSNSTLFLVEVKSILESLGGPVTFYSENDILNNIVENEFSLLIETGFTYDDFISLFLIHLLGKLKAITHKIKFTFKLLNDNQYLITIWTENEIIKNHIIPTLNQIFTSNTELYNNLKPKYPYHNKTQQINDLLTDTSFTKELQLIFSQYILELKLNENEELSEGYRLSLGIFFSIEILQALFPNKDIVKKITNLLFEEWLSMSYETSNTNWNDLELQSYKVVNDLENLYLAQFETLNSNFGDSIKNWEYTDESGLELEQICKKIYNSYNTNSIFNSSLSNNNIIDGFNNSIQIILFEVLSILGITNYNKTYIIYDINRLLHEA